MTILIGTLLLLLTTLVHSGFTILAVDTLRRLHAKRSSMRSHWTRSFLVAGLVLMMFVASLIEVGLYAFAYLRVGAIEGIERAMYFSMVTFTTLGYGEIVLGEDWRMLASFEAANGIILFGWTTALIFAFIQHMVEPRGAD
jgi:Ion channel